MKCSAFVNLAVISVVLASGVIGCKKNPKGSTPIPTARVGDGTPSGPQGDFGGTVKPPIRPGDSLPLTNDFSTWLQDRSAFSAQTVYFDLDKSVVKASEMSKVEAVAARMKTETGKAVRVEGHCDERGTEEYNRALGERRALAIREALVTLGMSPDSIDTISF